MLAVIIPTLNAEAALVESLPALVPATVAGVVNRVVISDGGSADATARIAQESGADFIAGEPGRGGQLQRGARHVSADWYLFLHADTVLEAGWHDAARRFMAEGGQARAAAFRFRLDDRRFRARILERYVALRSRLFALPYGDQALLIPRCLYEEIGGYRDLPLMEDVDIIRRIGRRRLAHLNVEAVTSAGRFRRDGYLRRSLKNFVCLMLWFAGVSSERIARIYA